MVFKYVYLSDTQSSDSHALLLFPGLTVECAPVHLLHQTLFMQRTEHAMEPSAQTWPDSQSKEQYQEYMKQNPAQCNKISLTVSNLSVTT